MTLDEILEEKKRETKRHFLDYLKDPEEKTKAQTLIQSSCCVFVNVDVPNDPIKANRSQSLLQKALVPPNTLSPRVFYDCDGWFLTEIIKGAEQGFHVSDMITNVLYTDQQGSCPVRDSFNLFPCIIVVKKKYIKKLISKMASALETGGMNDSDKKQYEESKKMLEDCIHNYELHLKRQFSFFNNSSIWVRLVDWDDDAITKAKQELGYFEEIGLYKYDSAKENLDYNIRVQEQNYLDDATSSGHGSHVTPVLYGDEETHYDLLFNEQQ